MSGRRVLLLCGGRSEEHDVSLASARSVLEAVDGSPLLEVVPLVIGRDGAALGLEASARLLGAPVRPLPNGRAAHGPDAGEGQAATDGEVDRSALASADHGPDRPAAAPAELARSLADAGGAFDVVFPLLHGPYGEDGSVQGLLKLMGLPFVGSDVLGSAVSMDKLAMKAAFAAAGLPQVEHRAVTRHAFRSDPEAALAPARELGLPVFVKPANLGSSIGVSRVDDPADLQAAVAEALGFDRRAIVEAAAMGARELEVAVLGNDEPVASGVGEVRVRDGAGAFYDYQAKYTDGRADLFVPADVPEEVARAARAMALEAFAAVDAAGLARVDFFYLPDGRLLVNEINTIPGFTRHSMYPRLWQAAGLSYPELIERLVELAVERR
ncbi:MAG TPA: D-alanine--D-alanine ligase family protein [Trueperaceae bacterium]|nr:D-alanine--D-alanine ligase family protein [Trueperaceae bacterium]